MSNNESSIMVEYLDTLKMQNKALPSMTMSKIFRQFFTPQKYSQIMIENLNVDTPKKILDLSMGEGSLLIEAMKTWKNSEFIGNDIDINCCKKIKKNYSNIVCFNENIFKLSSVLKIKEKVGKVDLCLANPPFHLIIQDENTRKILQIYNLEEFYKSVRIPAEIIFILQCLEILNNGGTLSIILPDGFFVNAYLREFRNFLLSTYKIEKLIELPNNIFEKTDAKTHILILKKEKYNNQDLILYSVSTDKEIKIKKSEALNRMDYSYYDYIKRTFSESNKLLAIKSFDVKFVRGKAKYLIKDIDNKYILHTTNFSKGSIFFNQLRTPKKLLAYEERLAIPGDIVVARVGSYCIGKIGIVEKGFFVATDCVFLVRIKNKDLRSKVFQLLKSELGQEWIKANSKGVSAKHITMEDFKKFPILGII